MKTIYFQDGERLVFVLEDASQTEKNEAVKRLASLSTDTERAASPKAEPAPPLDRRNFGQNVRELKPGPADESRPAGTRCAQIRKLLQVHGDPAYRHYSNLLKSGQVTRTEDRQELCGILAEYVRSRFRTLTEEEVEEMSRQNTLNEFLNTFISRDDYIAYGEYAKKSAKKATAGGLIRFMRMKFSTN